MQLFIQSGDLGPKWFHVAIRAMVLMADSEVLLKSNHIAELLGEDPTTIRKILSMLLSHHRFLIGQFHRPALNSIFP
ncbi:MAG: Rrf2 family transcriptional regulator [Herbinix sp.]|nr:Rrf2 family transcriptional regulator [Herbinix sp.]